MIVRHIVNIDLNTKSTTRPAVIAAIVSGGKTLLVRNPELQFPQWKFPAGGVEMNETPLQALVREIAMETGFSIPCVENGDGTLTIGDDYTTVHHLSSTKVETAEDTHTQHRFLIEPTDVEDILRLDRQFRKEDRFETLETGIRVFSSLVTMTDFLWKQFDMLKEVTDKLQELSAA